MSRHNTFRQLEEMEFQRRKTGHIFLFPPLLQYCLDGMFSVFFNSIQLLGECSELLHHFLPLVHVSTWDSPQQPWTSWTVISSEGQSKSDRQIW